MGEGVTPRYAACALALEFGFWDVDAMLESMTRAQFNEWAAFFNVRARLRKGELSGVLVGKPDTSKEGQQALARKVIGLLKRHNKTERGGR